MKKIMILAASAALVLAGCAKIETVSNQEMDAPVGFSAYTSNALTKAGAYGEMNNTLLQQTEANGGGFGVFAYKTSGDYPTTNTTLAPNFMYNQKVLYNAGAWGYSPIKYWPNQLAGTPSTGADTDSQTDPAHAYAVDKVSFFAYAPYVAATASSGAVATTNEGIIKLSDYDDTSDPKVTYKVTNDLDKQVDLVWGVSHGATWNNVAGGTNTPANGKPYLNLQKPAINTAIHFYFHHALAQLKLQAIAAYNQVAAGGEAKNGVKITIDNVVITVPGMYETAVLNLNNTAVDANNKPIPLWESEDGDSDLTLTVAKANINAKLQDGGDVNASAQPAGVIYKAAPYTKPFDEDVDVIMDGKYFTLIPKSGSDVTVNVKVTYYVTTDDANLANGHSRVENVISHDVTFTDGFKAGTRNIIRMILGVSEVKFEASVEDWVDGLSADVDLPKNS